MSLRVGPVSRGNEKKGQGGQIGSHLNSLLMWRESGSGHVLLEEFLPHKRRHQGWEVRFPSKQGHILQTR